MTDSNKKVQLMSRRTALTILSAAGALAVGLMTGGTNFLSMVPDTSTSIIVSRFQEGYVIYGISLLGGQPVSIYVNEYPDYAVLIASGLSWPIGVEIVEVSNALVGHLTLADSERGTIELF